MDSNMRALELVQALGRKMGITDLVFDAEGTVAFDIDATYTLVVGAEPEKNAITLYAPIKDSDGKRHDGLLETLLTANFMWQATQGATLSIDAATDLIVLHSRLPLAQLGDDEFEKAVEAFANTLQTFTAVVAGAPGNIAGTTSFDAPLNGVRV